MQSDPWFYRIATRISGQSSWRSLENTLYLPEAGILLAQIMFANGCLSDTFMEFRSDSQFRGWGRCAMEIRPLEWKYVI